MLVAFSGWPAAAEAATRALRYLVRNLGATKFAEIDPEEFYDFTVVRPHLRKGKAGGNRSCTGRPTTSTITCPTVTRLEGLLSTWARNRVSDGGRFRT